jgi:hypothetical protein
MEFLHAPAVDRHIEVSVLIELADPQDCYLREIESLQCRLASTCLSTTLQRSNLARFQSEKWWAIQGSNL